MTEQNRNEEDRLNEVMEDQSEDALAKVSEEGQEEILSELDQMLRKEMDSAGTAESMNEEVLEEEIREAAEKDESLFDGGFGESEEAGDVSEYGEALERSAEFGDGFSDEIAPGEEFSDGFGYEKPSEEDYGELPGMNGGGQKKSKKKWILIGAAVLLCVIAAVSIPLYLKYQEKVEFYEEHFFAGTYINGVDFSDCTPIEAEKTLMDQIDVYQLTIQTREGSKIVLNGSDINLEAEFDIDFQGLLDQQNPKEWYKLREETFEYDTDTLWSYDEALLKKWFESQKYFDESTKVKTEEAELVFEEGLYQVTEAVQGTRMDMKLTLEEVEKAVKSLKTELKLADTKCYLDPIIDLDSSELEETAEKLNSYVKSEVTYDLGEGITEIVDAERIRSCLSVDDQNEVVFDTTPLSDFVTYLQDTYDTYGSSRDFLTHYGSVITVYGGSYGWKLNWQATFDDLVAHVQSGEPSVLQPIYDQSAVSHGTYDYGGTYAEVDMNSQAVYYYVNGQLAHTAACVTGKPSDPTRDLTTPTGTYQILELLSPKTMTGEIMPNGKPEYVTDCTYWMRITWGGVGFHDATWQPRFGGDWYLLHGSHGCINLSYSDAKYFYGQFYVGMPVIMYGGVKKYTAPVVTEPEPTQPETSEPETEPTTEPTQATTQAPPETLPPETTTAAPETSSNAPDAGNESSAEGGDTQG